MRIGIHAGHNPDGKRYCGAVGLIKESTEARKVKDEVIRLLKLVGHTVYDCTVEDGTSVADIVNKQVANSNKYDLDLTVSIHFNAGVDDVSGNGASTGTEVLMTSIEGIKKTVGERIVKNISSIGFKNRGLKVRNNLGFLNRTKAPAVLVECCFINDKDDVKLYNYKTMAKAVAEGINGEAIKEKPNTESNADIIYRVIAGSFSSRSNADKQLEKLKGLGVSGVFIEAKKN